MGYSPGRSPREPSMSIPIPSHYPPSMGSMGSAERSPRPLPSPSSSRSPSQSSLASYRAHPYPRRSSLTQQQQQQSDNDRIFLPPPNSNSPLHVLHEGRHDGRRRDSGEEHERTHSADRGEREREQQQRERERDRDRSEWRDRRPSLARTHSDGRFTSDRSDRSSLQLPPFSSLTASSATSSPSTYPGGPLTPTSNGAPPPTGAPMGPPGVPASTSPNGSRTGSPKLFALGGLRPSYSYDAPNPSGGRLGLTNAGPGRYRSEYSPPRYDRERDQRGSVGGVGPDRSPPLRSIHQQQHPHYTDAYQQGRARSHSAASALGRYPQQAPGPRSSSSDGDWQSPPTPREVQAPYPAPTGTGGGQSRRLAHLMSEQKRRE